MFGNRLHGLTSEHPLFSNLLAEGRLLRLMLDRQTYPPSPPDCQPNGGFPSCPETEPEPEPGDPDPDPPGDPEPPEPGDLAGWLAAAEATIVAQSARLAAHQATIEALQAALEALAGESRETDAAHAGRLDAIEENMPPRRLRLWAPAPDGEFVETPVDG